MLLIRYLTLSLVFLACPSMAADKKEYGDFNKPMKFVVAGNGGNCNGCEWISAIGVIDKSTPAAFEQFRKEHPYQETIQLHSPGGNLMAGMELGRLFRKYNLPTSIGETQQVKGEWYSEVKPGVCASACAYAFLGGASRSIDDGSQIGFHQFYGNKPPTLEARAEAVQVQGYMLSAEQLVSGIIAAYTVEMGVDARVLTLASLAGKDEMLSPNESELKELKVITSSDSSPLSIELFGNGIRAYSTNDYVGYPVRRESAFCAGANKQAMLSIDVDKTGHAPEDLKKAINKLEFSADDEKNKRVIPLENLTVKSNNKTDSIIIALPDELKNEALAAKWFKIDLDTARVTFGTWIAGGFAPTAEERKMLRLAWSNCI